LASTIAVRQAGLEKIHLKLFIFEASALRQNNAYDFLSKK